MGLCTVQIAILPYLISHSQSLYKPYSVLRDVCISAPTGSGKTLAYVLPILEVSCSVISTFGITDVHDTAGFIQ